MQAIEREFLDYCRKRGSDEFQYCDNQNCAAGQFIRDTTGVTDIFVSGFGVLIGEDARETIANKGLRYPDKVPYFWKFSDDLRSALHTNTFHGIVEAMCMKAWNGD